MIRTFTQIKCVYYNDKNYIPAIYDCPDLTFDDVILKLSTDLDKNTEKVAKIIVDYAFAIFCANTKVENFTKDHYRYSRDNWKLLNYVEKKNESTSSKPKQQ
jgi:hypothetical protein